MLDDNIISMQEFYDGVCQYNQEYQEVIKNKRKRFFDFNYLLDKFANNSFAQSFIYDDKNEHHEFIKHNQIMDFSHSPYDEDGRFLSTLIRHYILKENYVYKILQHDEKFKKMSLKFYKGVQDEDFDGYYLSYDPFAFAFSYDKTRLIVERIITSVRKNKKNIYIGIQFRPKDEMFFDISKKYDYNEEKNLCFDIIKYINHFICEDMIDEMIKIMNEEDDFFK